MNVSRREAACFILAALGCFACWLFPYTIFDHHSPLEALKAYLAALFGLGVLCRLLFQGSPKLIFGGVALGEFLGLLYPSFDPAISASSARRSCCSSLWRRHWAPGRPRSFDKFLFAGSAPR